ncbi:MAG: hypothetical protein ABUS79_02770 [Pseudomonadota bacterium]
MRGEPGDARFDRLIGCFPPGFVVLIGMEKIYGPSGGRGRRSGDHRHRARAMVSGSSAVLTLTLALVITAGAGACGGGGAAPSKADGSTPDTVAPGLTFCGNGVRDDGEACEGFDGCGPGLRCTEACACAPAPAEPTTSQGLIAAALAKGTFDYPTSLLYRAYALFGDSRLPPAFDGARRRGEDNALFLEASRAWGSLTPDVRAALEPFMVRPTDPKSIYAPAGTTAALLRAGAGGASLADAKCPFAPGAATPDWRSTPSTHFVVWSCGGGDLAQDADAAARGIVSSVAEQAWNAITPEAAKPRPDSFPGGAAGPDQRIDIYIVQGADCHDRQGACAPIETEADGTRALAAVVPAPPCDRAVNGAITSSAYMLVDRGSIPAAVAGPSKFRYVFAHEFFHVVSNAMNLEAQGGACFDPRAAAPTAFTSWLTEASAEWAAWAFFADDGPGERKNLFLAFQEYRPPDRVSLLDVDNQRPYEAFLYPFFLQQEKGGARTAFLDMWKGSASARRPEDLDDGVDRVLGFAGHFRDFTVRNFNRTVELPPSVAHYQGQDSAIPVNESPVLTQPGLMLALPGVKFSRSTTIAPLAADYEHYLVNDNVRYVRIDTGPLVNAAFVDLDALAKVGSQWERRQGRGGVLEFCRDDRADDIREFYLIVTNHDRRRGQMVSGGYEVQMRGTCPAGWSGSIRYVETVDEDTYASTPNGVYTTGRHKRIEQTWTVVGNTPAAMTPLGFDQIETRWHATLSEVETATAVGPACFLSPPTQGDPRYQRSVTTGAGTGTRNLGVTGTTGSLGLTIVDAASNVINGTLESFVELCDGKTVTRSDPSSPAYESLSLVLLDPAFFPLKAAPGNPNQFTGRASILHSEQPGADGTLILDITATWDLTRIPQR